MLTIFKPNKNNTGSFFQLNFGPDRREENGLVLYITARKQINWDSNKKRGAFDSKDSPNNVTVKLSLNEVGGIIDRIAKTQAFAPLNEKSTRSLLDPKNSFYHVQFYHQTPDSSTIINFGPSRYDDKSWYPQGFWLKLSKSFQGQDAKRFTIGLSFDEAQHLKSFLEKGIHQQYRNEGLPYSKPGTDAANKPQQAPAQTQKAPATEPAPEKPEEDNPFSNAPTSTEEVSPDENPFTAPI